MKMKSDYFIRVAEKAKNWQYDWTKEEVEEGVYPSKS